MTIKGVHYDKTKNRWIAKIQRNYLVIRKGFVDENKAIEYRKKLEESFMDNNQINNSFPTNQVRQRELKTIEYLGHMQSFNETNLITGETNNDKFYVPLSKARVLHQGTATIVTLEDGSVGRSVCGKDDVYSRKTGLKIAYNRAMIQRLKKEIEKLSGGNN